MKQPVITIAFVAILLNGCGHSSNTKISDDLKNEQNQSLNSFPGGNLKAHLTFDVLGGMFRRTEVAASNVGKSSASLPPPIENSSVGNPASEQSNQPGTTETTQETTREGGTGTSPIHYSNQYVGLDGFGRLTLTATGEVTEWAPENYPEEIVRHFAPINLRFIFRDYLFQNPCFGPALIEGEIFCEAEGDYEIQPQTFLGSVRCHNGPQGNPKPLLYISAAGEYNIELDAQMTIDGDLYRYKSYQYQGEISINGERGRIDEWIKGDKACSL